MMVLIVGMCGRRAQIQTPLPLSDYYSPLLFSRALIHNGLKIPATVVNERSHCLGSVKTRDKTPLHFSFLGRYLWMLEWCLWINPLSHFNLEEPILAPQTKVSMDGFVKSKSCEARMFMELLSKIFLLWCLEHCLSTTSISTSQMMCYSTVMQRCEVTNLSVSHVEFFMMSSPSSGTLQSRKGCSERNSDGDKSVWGGFWSEPWANVLLWGAVFFPLPPLYI